MAKAKQGDTVRVHYTGKLDDGSVFDSSQGRDPFEFTIGSGQVIPGFENAVIGMEPGETKTAICSAEDAYGAHREDMVAQVPLDRMPADLTPEVGQRLQASQADGSVLEVVITDVGADTVTIDGNHPLAGKQLTFDIELIAIN
ncbi:MAG: peptidylprolyl isomerase [Candidatus Zixiibacteriota bacterium]|nr:MAG: peptidylprolyl isomerase [candidate division Zixibacteria bacterium]